ESEVIMRPTCAKRDIRFPGHARSVPSACIHSGPRQVASRICAGCDRIDTSGACGPPRRGAPAPIDTTPANGKPRQNRGQRHADCPHPRAGRRGEGRLVVMVSKTTCNGCKSRLRTFLLLRLLRALGLAGARGLGHHGLLRGALACGLLGSALACRLLGRFLRGLPHRLACGLACRGGFRLGGLACTLLGRLLGGFLRSFLGSHGSSQLLISWQWLPSERMQKRLAQKITVRGVPQVGHLTACTLVGKQPEYMQRNRDGDLPNLLGFGTVLDVRLYVLGSRHVSFLRHVVGRKASPTQTWCQSIFCGK